MYIVLVDFLLDQLKLLGLNDREVRVFTALSTFGQMNMTKVAGRAGLPRTTVDAIVRRLLEQGLVRASTVKNHQEYAVDLSELVAQLESLQCRLQPTSSMCSAAPDQQNGTDTALDLSLYQGDRARGLVSRVGSDMAATAKRLVLLHTIAANYEIALETLVCRALMTAARDQLHTSFASEDLRGHFLHVVPESYCDGQYDLLLLRDAALFYGEDGMIVQVVKDPLVVNTMHHLSSMAIETGWRLELSHWI